LMITLPHEAERFKWSSDRLAEVGVNTTLFPGVDANMTQDVLDAACQGPACLTPTVKALIESHHRAWLAAENRSQDWTLILENDAVPQEALPNWNEAFQAAWNLVPSSAGVVRLGRCVMFNQSLTKSAAPSNLLEYWSPVKAGVFVATEGTGFSWEQIEFAGCTHAYMVHRKAVPILNALLPCPCALDCCLNNMYVWKQPWEHFVWNIDMQRLPSYAEVQRTRVPMVQVGIMKQEWARQSGGATHSAAQTIGLDWGTNVTQADIEADRARKR